MYKLIISIIFLICLNSCQSEFIEGIQYEFTSPKIAIDGALVSEKKCTLNVTRSILSSDKIFDLKNAALSDAIVVLSSNTLVDTLKFDSNSYSFVSNIIIAPNKYYNLIVVDKLYGTASVDSIFVPGSFNLTSAILDSISPDNTFICGTSQRSNLEILLNLEFNDNYKEEVFFDIFYPNGGTGICKRSAPTFENLVCEQEKGKLLPLSCLQPLSKLKIEAIGFGPNNRIKVKVPYEIIIGNKSYKNFKESTNERLGVELGLLDPVTYFSNVKNGYGLVSGYYSISGVIEYK